MFVFVIDDNDTQADEAHIMCLKPSSENKSSAVYLVFISVKVRSLIYNRKGEYQVKLFYFLCVAHLFARSYMCCASFLFVFVMCLVSNVTGVSGLSIRHCFVGYF